jgi:hypothetical protein
MPPPPIPSELVALHKHILVLFTQYDALSKKIRNYPPAAAVKGLPSSLEVDVSAQRRVQEAIARSAAAFVTKEAGILQVSLQLTHVAAKPNSCWVLGSSEAAEATTQASGVFPQLCRHYAVRVF